MKKAAAFFFCVVAFPIFAQHKSIHQEQSETYATAGHSAEDYYSINSPSPKTRVLRNNCTPNKIIYGWHPYWSNGLQSNYDWDLLTHFSYFSYEVNYVNGNANNTYNFATTQSVTDALNNGLKVTLCVTLFSDHATFLNNNTSKQTLITNLINLISARGAHGVNIDFEGLPASQSLNFRNFMNDLANQMHSAIPGSEVSTVLYAVDWNNVLDVANMTAVDHFIIMGYDYYWTGSTTAGPNDPLFQFGTSYNYTLSKSITYYLNKGIPPAKLILGLPYYGREWPVSSHTLPATTTGSGLSRTYRSVRDNVPGIFSAANRRYEPASKSTYYNFNSGGLRQCFITEADDMRDRMDLINKRGIGGMGIWALGYDDGYNDFWDAISDNFTDCSTIPCSDTLTDIGGGRFKNYYDNENYTYTIAPPNAGSVTLTFSSFSLENNYDFLYVYNGPGTTSPQFPGSPFTGTTLPPALTGTTAAITLRFTSDNSTTSAGFVATYQCTSDNQPPTTGINASNNWKTANFSISFTDQDAGSGVARSFWQVMDNNGTEWRANGSHGFFNDNFSGTIHSDWTQQSGTWIINSGRLAHTDESNGNTNIFAAVTQTSSYQYLYHWQGKMSGTGTNRRSGIHFFCDNPSLPNRGNSYFVYFRVDQNKCQIYEVVNDVFTLMTDHSISIAANTWYDYKITYDPTSGTIKAYVNNVLVSQWTDSTPLIAGNSISLRSANVNMEYDDVKVYRSRTTTENVSLGSSSAMVRYQNNGPANSSCRIRTMIIDNANNWSNSASQDQNIDWTPPTTPAYLQEGISVDIDTTHENLNRSASWGSSNDPHSGIQTYSISIGTTPGDSSILNWQNTGNVTGDTITGINLVFGQSYYLNIRAVNGASLRSLLISSNGFYVTQPTAAPIANFTSGAMNACTAFPFLIFNSSTNATGFLWNIPGGNPSTSTATHPEILFPSSGNYTVTLTANGPSGTDVLSQQLTITLIDPPVASFSVNDTLLYLPGAYLAISNWSQNASSYSWNFGDSTFSTDPAPWHLYNQSGIYQVLLI